MALTCIAAAVVPEGYSSLVDYVNRLGDESGVRALPVPDKAGLPIIAMTANAFAMDAHIASPSTCPR